MKKARTYRLKPNQVNALLEKLKEHYTIYAPVLVPSGGRYSGQDSIMYREVDTYEEIEYRDRATYPLKEVLTPITQTLFYFTDDEFRETKEPEKDLLIFGRACDINAIKIQDQIYLNNGNEPDFFYKRIRDRVKFILMECTKQFEGCFCCSVGANETSLHSMAISFANDHAHIEVTSAEFEPYFETTDTSDYTIKFPQENELKVNYPVIESLDLINKLKEHHMWNEFDDRCIACGACTVACSTCTCFETTDIVYTQNAHIGERRRTCSSCMVDGFDEMAGGHCFRPTTQDRYRYKILHKVYAHNARFHSGPMCVGCGRCSARCPELISYPETLRKLATATEELNAKESVRHAE